MRSVDRAVSHESRGVCVGGRGRDRNAREKGSRRRERGRAGKERRVPFRLTKNGLKLNGLINGRLTVNGIEVPLDHSMLT